MEKEMTTTTIHIPKYLWGRFKAEAALRGITVNVLMTEVLEEAFEPKTTFVRTK